jgi:hypothetical protein
MRLGIQYDMGDGWRQVTAGPSAFRKWETANHTKASKLFTDGIGIGDLTELAWWELQKTDSDIAPLEVWADALVNIEPVATADPE